jgi:hypothetical protein
MTLELEQIVAVIEQGGGSLILTDDGRVSYSVPANPNAPALLEVLRQHRDRLVEYLRNRAGAAQIERAQDGSPWLDGPLQVERRFLQPHAKLFPLLGRKVRTPEGSGTLLQVFADRVTVLLDRDLKKCSFFSPAEVQPVSEEWPK